tara:strand:+ start:2974 stop:3561 length:588 start_codon:yes stop_codon:yes gene_type:complete
MAFNIDDYIEVKDRVKQLKKDYPDSVIQTDVIELTDTRVTIKAFIYLDNEGKKPTTGHSYMNIPGTTSFTRGSELENAETSAVGRAIANLGYAIDKSIASRDEVQSKQVEEGYEAPKSQRPPQQGQYLGNARTYSGSDTRPVSQAQVEKYIPGIVRDSGKSEDEVQAMLRLLDAETYSDLTRDALAKFETMLKNP